MRHLTAVTDAPAEDTALEASLVSAVWDGHHRTFELHYQPLVDLRSGTVVGHEALIRWDHPALGLLPPATWLPIAEETGLIVALGEWVLHEACAQATRTETGRIAVNVSARQLADPGFAAMVDSALSEAGLAPHRLTLEITETHLLTISDRLVHDLRVLRDAGCRISADDFGTGYSTIAALVALPIGEIKIDKSFVDGLGVLWRADAVVRGVLDLAHGMGARVVAEGVETPAQLDALRELGCDLAQGYLLGRPSPAPMRIGAPAGDTPLTA